MTMQQESARQAVVGLPRKRRFELMRWVVLIVAIYAAVVLTNFLVFNGSWNWELVGTYLFSQRIVLGVWNTIWLTVVALSIGLSMGLIVCAARVSRFPILRMWAFAYIWAMRATPPLVVMLLIYFLGALKPTVGVGLPFAPSFIEWPTNEVISPFTASVIGLSIYLGGKSAEIFRGGYVSVGTGQYEAIKALGISPWTALVRVTGPQAVRVLTPPLANEVVTMFKNTSLVSVIGFAELLTTVQRIYAVNFETIPMLTVACIWYLGLTSLLMAGQIWLERRSGRGFERRATEKTDKPSQGFDVPIPHEVPLAKTLGAKDASND